MLEGKLLLKEARANARKLKKTRNELEPDAVLQCTEKLSNCALLVQQRCISCHGQMVRDVVGTLLDGGTQYSKADLKYDIKSGRLATLPPGTAPGKVPEMKPRADAPCAGQPLPTASVDEFFCFLQCQLRMELNQHTQEDLTLPDERAVEMWPDVEKFITPNLGLNERWVPYHTILGVHELFVAEAIHSRKDWTEHQKLLALFIFRAHCKRDLFTTAQLPVMDDTFWKDPRAAFEPEGAMFKAILKYRKDTNQPLLTSCFRIIPPRVLPDDTENLVRSITDRTLGLLDVAARVWPILKSNRNAIDRITEISEVIQDAPGCGDTWAKMLTVCIDLAYPHEQFLEKQCDVGVGAAPALRALLPSSGSGNRLRDLKDLLKVINGCDSRHAEEFWAVLEKVEEKIKRRYKSGLIEAQASTQKGAMAACTLQVQLCEYRQFRHSVARLKYGMPDDENFRPDAPEPKATFDAENFVELNEDKNCVQFDIPLEGKKHHLEVPLEAVDNQKMVAARVAGMCFYKMKEGTTLEDALVFRDEVLAGYRHAEDVPEDSPAWHDCRIQLSHPSPLTSWQVEPQDGKPPFPFQTTKAAAGGVLECERIARLCYTKFLEDATIDEVREYRNALYRQNAERASSEVVPAKETPIKQVRTAPSETSAAKRPRKCVAVGKIIGINVD